MKVMLELYRFNNKSYEFSAGSMKATVCFHCPRHIYKQLPKELLPDLEEFIRKNTEQFFKSHHDLNHEDLKDAKTKITFRIVRASHPASVDVHKKRALVNLDSSLFTSYPHVRLDQINIKLKTSKLPLSDAIRHELLHVVDFYKAGMERQHTLNFVRMAKFDKFTAYFHDLLATVRQEGVAKLAEPGTGYSIDWLKVTQFRLHLLKTVKGLHNIDISTYLSENSLWTKLEKDNFWNLSRAHDIGHFMALVIAYAKMPKTTMLTPAHTLRDIDTLLRKGKTIELPSPDALAATEKELLDAGVREFIAKFDSACDQLGVSDGHRPITLRDFERYTRLCMDIEHALTNKADVLSREQRVMSVTELRHQA
jgi:hypothetical protein